MRTSDRIVYGLMAGFFVVAYIVLILAMVQPAHAADNPPPDMATCETLVQVEEGLVHSGAKFVELDSNDLIGLKGKGLGKLVVTTMNGNVVFGFERDGCMWGPVVMAEIDGTGV